MILKKMSLAVAQCCECEKLIVYKPAEGFPDRCDNCGCPGQYTPTKEERQQAQQYQQRNVHTMRF